MAAAGAVSQDYELERNIKLERFMNIIEKRLDEIQPYEHNPRNNDAAVEYVANSLREFGWKQPIVIDKDGIIIAGHTRYKAAKRLGMKTAPCIMADDLTPEQVKAYRLADNKTGEFAEWDFSELEMELADIEMDMSAFGFLEEELNDVEAVEDDYVPAPPDEPKAKHGDIYKLGRHRLMCGDSTSAEDIGALVGEAQIDLLLTDPPYNVDYSGTAGKIKNDNMESARFREFLRDAFLAAKTAMKTGAAFHIWHAETEGYNFRGACADAGFKCRQQLIWVKSSQTLGRQDFQRMYEGVLTGDNISDEEMCVAGYEPCLYGWKDGKGHKWYKKRKEKDVLFFDKPAASKEHPTMKPVKLFDYEMRCNTKEGDNVLDSFAGSGTTIIAAEQNGRNAFCMELDPRFVDVIIDRWEQFTGRKAELLNE
jgi:site-specific DNA-methyltransferase (adenine-specific)